MEPVDIVDENNTIISSTTKDRAHAEGLLHRTVIAEIKDSKGNWILVKQAGHKQDAGQFVSPVGGHVTSGEKPDEAVLREAEEECGLKIRTFTKIGEMIYNRDVLGHTENHYFIIYELKAEPDGIVLNDESVEYHAFSEEELKKELKENPMKFGEAFWVIVRKYYTSLIS